jgi:hypothetical protein
MSPRGRASAMESMVKHGQYAPGVHQTLMRGKVCGGSAWLPACYAPWFTVRCVRRYQHHSAGKYSRFPAKRT